MKNLCVAIVALTLLVSCGSKEDQLIQTAEKYLNSMYTGDYETAKTVSEGSVLTYVEKSQEMISGLNDQEKERLLGYMGKAQFVIQPVEPQEVKSDTVTVHYSLQFPSREATQETMQLRKEGKNWVVFKVD